MEHLGGLDDRETVFTLILLFGCGFAAVLVYVGVRLRWFHAHGFVAGYNTAPPEEREKYDIEGLSQHLGNGLINMGVLLAAAALALYWGSEPLFFGILTLFFLVVLITVIGGQKFRGRPGHTHHRMLSRVLSRSAYSAIERGTREWVVECRCGGVRDLWEVGGIRYKAVGEPRQWRSCPACGKASFQKVRKRRLGEALEPRCN